jgi:caa(3)-type oxidase subunit IV
MSEHAETDAALGEDQGHEEHHTDYVKIWKVLVVLLIISVLGPELEIQVVTLITAFGIALVKAYLVIKNFMHIDLEKPFIHYLMVVSLMLMVLFFTAVAPDVMNHEGTNWVNIGAEEEVHSRIQEKMNETHATTVNYGDGVLHDPSQLWGAEVENPFKPEVAAEGVEEAHH